MHSQEDCLSRLRDWLSAQSVALREVHHEPTYTSEDSARARGEELRVGGKALVMRVDDEPALFVLPADRKADSGAIRRELKGRQAAVRDARRAGGAHRARSRERAAVRRAHPALQALP